MIILAGLLIGAIIGATTARKRGGKPADMLQYAAGYGMAFAILGMIVTVIVDRTLI